MPAAVDVTLGGAIPARDISQIRVRRGRSDELDRHGPGTTDVALNIANDRANALAAEVAGELATVSIRNPVAGDYFQIYEGRVQSPQYNADPSRVVTRASVAAIDGLDRLRRACIAPDPYGTVNPNFGYEVPAGYAGQVFYEDAGQVKFRIEKLLDEAKWGPKRQIYSGNVGLVEVFYPGRTSILEIIQDCCEAELPGIGVFYVDRLGEARFKGRLSRFNYSDPQYDVQVFQAAAGDASKAQVRGLAYSTPVERVINAALFTPRNCPEHRRAGQVVLDAASIDQFGVCEESAEELQVDIGYLGDPNRTALQETRLYGVWYVSNYAQPRTRVDRLVFQATRPDHPSAAATWNLISTVDLSDVIELVLAGPGYDFNEAFFVESIDYLITPGDSTSWANVTLTLGLSPAAYYEVNPF